MTKTKMVCSDCGSEEVLFDAWARWNYEKQEFELDSTFENTHCEKCEGECSVNGIEEPDEEKERSEA